MTGGKAISFFNRFVKSIQPIFEKTFSSEYTGKVDYSAYTLIEDVSVKTSDGGNYAQRGIGTGISNYSERRI